MFAQMCFFLHIIVSHPIPINPFTQLTHTNNDDPVSFITNFLEFNLTEIVAQTEKVTEIETVKENAVFLMLPIILPILPIIFIIIIFIILFHNNSDSYTYFPHPPPSRPLHP